MKNFKYKYIFAAGGTGGHLYPAIAVAEKLKELKPESEILFIGTKNKIEAKVVPQLGFKFKTIWISGFSRKLTLKNFLFPVKLIVSIVQSLIIIISFKPNVAIGAGAYVSGPIVWLSSMFGSKAVLLEQNSYPGVTNRMLESKADKIFVSFEESKKYFKNQDKLVLSGNPIRTSLRIIDKKDALKEFSLNQQKKTLLVLGGSLGARSINDAIKENLIELTKNNIQIIWQTGNLYYDEYKKFETEDIKIMAFVNNMSAAYSASDLVLARAGATTIAEVAYLGLPVIFVPSKNVAANHQYKNAMSLVNNNAGLLIEDSKLIHNITKVVVNTINDETTLTKLRANIKKYSKPEAAEKIAESIINMSKIN